MSTDECRMIKPLADDRCLLTLSRLLFSPEESHSLHMDNGSVDSFGLLTLTGNDLPQLLSLARDHHVAVRALLILRDAMIAQNANLAYWAANAIEEENARVENALSVLNVICATLQRYGCVVSVIKSLDRVLV